MQISLSVTTKLISAFVVTTPIVQFLYFLNPKFEASGHLLCLYSLVCVGPVLKPHCWLSHDVICVLKVRVAEESGLVRLLVVRAQGYQGDISVEWRTTDDTAKSSGKNPPDFTVSTRPKI